MFSSLEIVVFAALFLLLLVAFVIFKPKKSSAKVPLEPVLPVEDYKPAVKQDLMQPVSPEQDEVLAKISKLENDLKQLSRSNSGLAELKTQIHELSSSTGSDVLFCPESDEPMRRIEVEGEDIDVSRAGCWFDPGELLSILDRSDSFLCKLNNIYADTSISKIENSISKEKEIESRKKYVALLYSEFTRTNSSVIKDKISLHNKKIRYLIYGAPQGVSSLGNITSQPSTSNILSGQNTPQHGTSFNQAISASSGHQYTHSTQSSSLICPVSKLPMTRIDVDGIELDVSPYGVWFDGTENLGTSKPEILQVLERKQNIFARLFGSPSLAKIIEQKTDDVSKKFELENKKLEIKKAIIVQSASLSRIDPRSAHFSQSLNQLQVEIRKLEKFS